MIGSIDGRRWKLSAKDLYMGSWLRFVHLRKKRTGACLNSIGGLSFGEGRVVVCVMFDGMSRNKRRKRDTSVDSGGVFKCLFSGVGRRIFHWHD